MYVFAERPSAQISGWHAKVLGYCEEQNILEWKCKMRDVVRATATCSSGLALFHGPVGVNFRAVTELTYKDCRVFVASLELRIQIAVADQGYLAGELHVLVLSLLINTSYSVIALLCHFVLQCFIVL